LRHPSSEAAAIGMNFISDAKLVLCPAPLPPF
jgi:hypothetical protein